MIEHDHINSVTVTIGTGWEPIYTYAYLNALHALREHTALRRGLIRDLLQLFALRFGFGELLFQRIDLVYRTIQSKNTKTIAQPTVHMSAR